MCQTQAALRAEYVCSCFFTRQIFIKKYGLHVTFENEAQFEREFRQGLRFRGCSTDKQYADVLLEVKAEQERRKNYHTTFLSNYLRNQESYSYVHPELKQLQRKFLDARFLDISQDRNLQSPETLLQTLTNNGGFDHGEQVYSFPLFTPEFCNHLAEEITHFRESTLKRSLPNTMNSEGVSLDEMGLSYTLLTSLIQDYLQPITKLLFPAWGGGTLDSFKSFVVCYEVDKQQALSKHFDNAEVSMSVCLNSEFEGGDLQLGEMLGEAGSQWLEPVQVKQKKGHCILHRSRQFHSADPISRGKRINMIVWMRSSSVRNLICPMCGQAPDIREVPIAGDGFTPSNTTAACACV
ncbi:2-oxoglutarate and iron-dependent oxygenase domain-containing protein 2-like [Plakobranchus ocellatus]|uniref:2-oxoglutarate and iron-dependent oxygenase domain-containing protein 2-like n=1 Tax=Plakobranchus ocellatus TaxID=259542 RepID=A0AAV3YJL0_9GAST|nr:2-oxoglutarate and iron-dependent oxygenase domain-containing protein 2-like [Plakobranchus ocellatus]